MNKFRGIFSGAVGSPVQGAVDMSPDAALIVPQFLHCQGNINIFVGEGSIEKGYKSKSPSQNKPQLHGGQC